MIPPKRLQVISFLIFLAIVFVVVVAVLKPFLNIIALAIILAILFYPIYQNIGKRIKSENWAAFLTVLLVLTIILVPLLLFGQLVLNELLDAYRKVVGHGLLADQNELVSHLPTQWQSAASAASRDLNNIVARFTGNAFQTFSNIVSNLATFFISAFLLFFSLFYLLRDGKRILQVLMDLSPIATSQEDILFKKIIQAINGVVKGAFLVALAQGGAALIGFLIFGVPQPLLWAMATVLAALVPNVGTSLSMIPAVLYLFFTGHVTAGIGMAIWAALAVGLIDNVLSPKLIGSRLQLHPLLVLLSIVGGIAYFGVLGFLLGPILMAIFASLIDIYRTDFKDYLQS